MAHQLITAYFVAKGKGVEELTEDVSGHIEQYGAQPYGSMVVAQYDDPQGGYWRHFFQPMVTYKDG